MLAEDAAAVRALSSELTSLEAHFASADPPTSRFLRVLLALLSHDEPALPDMARLRPDYAASFERIFALIGDAGWAVRVLRARMRAFGFRACVSVSVSVCACVLGFACALMAVRALSLFAFCLMCAACAAGSERERRGGGGGRGRRRRRRRGRVSAHTHTARTHAKRIRQKVTLNITK
jgi:hypothetical protein